MNLELLRKQSKKDAYGKGNRSRFLLGYVLATIIALLGIGAFAAGVYGLTLTPVWAYFFDTWPEFQASLYGEEFLTAVVAYATFFLTYILEFVALIIVLLIAWMLVGLGLGRTAFFGIRFRYPMILSYRGSTIPKERGPFGYADFRNTIHFNTKVGYSITLNGTKMMRSILFPMFRNFVAFAPLVIVTLLYLAPSILAITGLDEGLGLELQLLSLPMYLIIGFWTLVFAAIMFIKFALAPYYIADDESDKLSFKQVISLSWRTMNFDNIILFFQAGWKYYLLKLPFIVVMLGLVLGAVFVQHLHVGLFTEDGSLTIDNHFSLEKVYDLEAEGDITLSGVGGRVTINATTTEDGDVVVVTTTETVDVVYESQVIDTVSGTYVIVTTNYTIKTIVVVTTTTTGEGEDIDVQVVTVTTNLLIDEDGNEFEITTLTLVSMTRALTFDGSGELSNVELFGMDIPLYPILLALIAVGLVSAYLLNAHFTVLGLHTLNANFYQKVKLQTIAAKDDKQKRKEQEQNGEQKKKREPKEPRQPRKPKE